MSTPIAQQAINTYLKLGSGSPATFGSPVANLGDMTGPGLKKTMVDVTSHSSAVPWIQRIGTILDGGDVKLPVFAVPGDANFTALINCWATVGFAGIYNWEIDWTDGTKWHFQASVSDLSMKAPVKGVYTAELTLAITGMVDFN